MMAERRSRTVNVRKTVFTPKRFSALSMTWRFETDSVGTPKMVPLAVSSWRPFGNAPSNTEKSGKSPIIVGVIEKDSFRGSVKESAA